MWLVFFADYSLHLGLYQFGVKPRTLEGIIGVFTSPFIHATEDFSHIITNSVPTLVLGWMLFYHYRTIALRSFLFIYFFTGIMVWILGRDSYHIGMSGVIYGMTSFLVVSGFLRKNMKVAAVSLVVIFLYGSTVWGIFPTKTGISWEAHAFGLIAGITIAFYYRKSGPQPTKLMYEIEEELGIEPDVEYWKHQEDPKKSHQPKIIINYTIVPQQPKVEKESSDNSQPND